METRNKLVFINCPFDSDYRPLLEAIVFAVSACQYTPRYASELIDSGYLRYTKILDLIDRCNFSLHDISRTELSTNYLPRFNMPFELGLALGRKSRRAPTGRLLIFDRTPNRYLEFISDLRGYDPVAHHMDPHILIAQVRDWLSSYQETPLNGPKHLTTWFDQFLEDLPGICNEYGFDRTVMPFKDLAFIIHYWLEANIPNV